MMKVHISRLILKTIFCVVFFFSGDIQAPDGQLGVLLGGEDGLVSDIVHQVIVHGRGLASKSLM